MIKSVIKQLKSNFEDCNIYGEEIEQGFKEPCFFVQIINTTAEMQGFYYEFVYSFDIQYFLDNNEIDSNKKYIQMGEKLIEFMECLHIDNSVIRGESINFEIIDNVLHFYISYKMMKHRNAIKTDNMEFLSYSEGVKNGKKTK